MNQTCFMIAERIIEQTLPSIVVKIVLLIFCLFSSFLSFSFVSGDN